MHIHIVGICGTFMGGVAALAKAAGHEVSGCDAGIYPPMSTQLKKLGIEIHEGFGAEQLDSPPDCVVLGNVVTRGFDVVEAMLDREIPYQSGPQWLAEHVLRGRHVFAVAGTHGKTTTASLLAWILEDAGLRPGYLIGGVPANFGVSARYGSGDCFVVEADEYDTAFFDKRAKFVHYRPRTLILNNLEYDHADIYADLDAIMWQFHQMLRTVPGSGRIVVNAGDENLARLLEKGCWTPRESFSLQRGSGWRAEFADATERHIRLTDPDGRSAETRWQLGGSHNLENALAAVAAARSAGVDLERAVDALSRFEGVKRRMERTATVGAIATMKRRFPGNRLVVAIEPRSNTMKLGVHNDELAEALERADLVWMYRPEAMDGGFDAALEPLGEKLMVFHDYDDLVGDMSRRMLAGDQVVFMSNGGFGGARQTLTAVLQRTRSS